MKEKKNLEDKFLVGVVHLEAVEFLGMAKLLGAKIYEEKTGEENVGEDVGENVGENVGEDVGEDVGENVGENVGEDVGENGSYAFRARPAVPKSQRSSSPKTRLQMVPFEEVLSSMIQKFNALERKKRREIVSLLEKMARNLYKIKKVI